MTDNTLNGKPRSLLQLALASPAFLEKDQEQVTTNEKAQTVICLGFLILAEWTGGFGDFPPNLAHSQKTAFPLMRGC
ncbi:MAG: hypothetical protein ACK52H_13200 [Burkholderiales bacterium]|jgi:hypothetical protein